MSPEEWILSTVEGNMREVVPELASVSITEDQFLADLGCNSIDRAEIVTLTLEELDVTVPLFELGKAHDLRSLVAVIARHL